MTPGSGCIALTEKAVTLFFWKLCHHSPILGLRSSIRGLHNLRKRVFWDITTKKIHKYYMDGDVVDNKNIQSWKHWSYTAYICWAVEGCPYLETLYDLSPITLSVIILAITELDMSYGIYLLKGIKGNNNIYNKVPAWGRHSILWHVRIVSPISMKIY